MDTAVAPHVGRPWAGPRAVVAYGVVVLVIAGTTFVRVPVDLPESIASFVTVWLAICLQALPFLVLGVLVSGAIVAFLPADTLLRVVPRSAGGAVFGAGLFGVVLPGCECGSVPVPGRSCSAAPPPRRPSPSCWPRRPSTPSC